MLFMSPRVTVPKLPKQLCKLKRMAHLPAQWTMSRTAGVCGAGHCADGRPQITEMHKRSSCEPTLYLTDPPLGICRLRWLRHGHRQD